MVEFMELYLAVPGRWKAYEVCGSRHSGSDQTRFNRYAINIEAGAYCTLSKALEEDDMKGVVKTDSRNMIIDNFAAAGGDPAEMKVLGTRNILNTSARTQIEKAFKSKQQDHTKSGSIRLDASEASFNACAILDPFEKDHSCEISDCGRGLGFAEPSAFLAISEGLQNSQTGDGTKSPAYHLVALLEPSKPSDTETAAMNIEVQEARKASMRNAIALIDSAITPLQVAQDDADGDQCIRDAIKVLDDAIRQLRS